MAQKLSQKEMEALINRRGGSKMLHSPILSRDILNPSPADAVLQPRITQEVEQWVNPETGHIILARRNPDGDGWIVEEDKADPTPPGGTGVRRPPEQVRVDEANAIRLERENQEKEANYNAGRGWITDEQYNVERNRQQQANQQVIASTRTADQQAAQNAINQKQVEEQARHNRAIEKGKPSPIGSASETEEYQMVFNPETGKVEGQKNPNYNAVKAQADAEQKRIATEIAQRRMSLDEGVEQYKQWFDTNVKVPFMQAEEARARATEQRQALDAEERRQQFAANFKLQKAELGQQAAATAIQAEQSLLPYRAGPTEAAEMSSAINSLAAGGNPTGPSAAAGINFTPGAFQFAAPNFKKIASQAVEAAVGGLTDYRPSKQSYSTGDYSAPPISVPSYSYGGGGGGGAPAYSAPAPSGGGMTDYSEYANPEDYQ